MTLTIIVYVLRANLLLVSIVILACHGREEAVEEAGCKLTDTMHPSPNNAIRQAIDSKDFALAESLILSALDIAKSNLLPDAELCALQLLHARVVAIRNPGLSADIFVNYLRDRFPEPLLNYHIIAMEDLFLMYNNLGRKKMITRVSMEIMSLWTKDSRIWVLTVPYFGPHFEQGGE